MKRILSLLVVLAMVIAMIPSVIAESAEIDFDLLTGKTVILDSVDEIILNMAEGDATKIYKWTPEKEGTLSVSFYDWEWPEGTQIDVTMTQGENSITYNPEEAFELEVVAGEAVSIIVSKTSEAAFETVFYGYFVEPEGTEGNPVALFELENTLSIEGATWYQTYMGGTTMTITGKAPFTVVVNGEEISSVDNSVSMAVTANRWMNIPFIFCLEEAGEYEIVFVYPVGSMENPAELVMGENTATIEEGSNGYAFKWTAEANGTLSITMPEGDWFYVINNITSMAYGDGQWSDSDPVMQTGTVAVKAGDEVEITVNTYGPNLNPGDPAPAGTLVITAAFEEVTYIPGDVDGNEGVDQQDAIYLLRHVLFFSITGQYPVEQPVDYNHDDIVDQQDAIYLLRHVLFFGITGQYPLT